jgi:predicted transcriptional regulator
MSNSYHNGIDETLKLAAQIVTAYVGTHTLPAQSLPGLIRDICLSLAELAADPVVTSGETASQSPSVFKDHMVCLECGQSMKMLKRHLLTVHQMTPDEYRAKWGLAMDHPMVAPDYAKVRSDLAKQTGLGRKPDDRPRLARPVRADRPRYVE